MPLYVMLKARDSSAGGARNRWLDGAVMVFLTEGTLWSAAPAEVGEFSLYCEACAKTIVSVRIRVGMSRED